MKSVIIAALAGLAAAQNLSGEPACATACLSSAISAAGCAPADQACQCGPTQADIGLKAAPCLIKSCAASDLIKAQSVGAALCLAYSVDAGLTTVTSTPSATSTSGTAPFVVSSTSGTPSNTATSTVVESSGTGGGVTGTKETFTTTPAPTTTGTGAGAGAGSSSSGGAGSSSSKTNLAAAASPVMIGGAIAAFMGAVAAL